MTTIQDVFEPVPQLFLGPLIGNVSLVEGLLIEEATDKVLCVGAAVVFWNTDTRYSGRITMFGYN